MPNFDVSVVGELNLDLIFYGLPENLELDREHLAKDLSITLGSSSAIFAHNFALLGNRVAFSSSIGSDPLGEIFRAALLGKGLQLGGERVSKGLIGCVVDQALHSTQPQRALVGQGAGEFG